MPLLVLLSALFLSACGQKGALYIAEKKPNSANNALETVKPSPDDISLSEEAVNDY